MNYSGIINCSIVDGIGFRTTLFISGCKHCCEGCQNPQTWCRTSGEPFTEEAEAELFDWLSRDYIDGVTFSGGDPLAPYNRDEVTRLCKKIRSMYNMDRGSKKKPVKTIWVYTGYRWEDVSSQEIMKYINYLVDGPFVEDLKDISLRFRGSRNQRIIDVSDALAYIE